jgi:hypothetical protein
MRVAGGAFTDGMPLGRKRVSLDVMCSMKTTVYIVALIAACVGCNRTLDSTPTMPASETHAAETQAALPAMDTALDTPDAKWRERFFKDSTAFSNIPEISGKSTEGILIRVTAKNVGTTTLEYSSQGVEHVQLFQETKVAGRWTKASWDWCGTGKAVFEIAPNASVDLVVSFWNVKKQERMLAKFSEKDTGRSGLVVLAVESER